MFRGFTGGRGSGKSWIGAYDLIRRGQPGRTFVATSPTYSKLEDEVIPTIREVGRLLGVWRDRDFRVTPRPSVRLSTGCTIRFRSTQEPDSLRGPNLSGFWMDEASLTDRDAYLVAIASLREGGRMGWLSATFTPKGRGHWTFETFGKDVPDTALFRAHTRENPFLPPEFADVIARQYGGDESLRARQELGGEFVQMEGAEWPAEYFDDRIWFRQWPPLVAKVLALDPSKGVRETSDYAAFVRMGADAEGTLWVEADLIRGKGVEYLAHVAVDHCRQWRPDAFGVETTFNQQIFAVVIRDEAKSQGFALPLTEIDNRVPKPIRIRRLGPYLAQGKIRFADTPGTRLLVQQLQEFPEGINDDGPDCCEMAHRMILDFILVIQKGSIGTGHAASRFANHPKW